MLSGGVAVFLMYWHYLSWIATLFHLLFFFFFTTLVMKNNVCFLCFIKNELILTLFQDAVCFIHFRITVPESVEDPLVFPGSSWSLVMRLHLMIMLKCGRWWEWRCDKWWCWPWLWLSAKLLYCLRIARLNLSFWWGRNDPAAAFSSQIDQALIFLRKLLHLNLMWFSRWLLCMILSLYIFFCFFF